MVQCFKPKGEWAALFVDDPFRNVWLREETQLPRTAERRWGMQQTGLTKGQPALRNDAANSGRVYRLSSLSMRFRMPYGVAEQAHAADAGWRVYDADARAGM